MYVYGLIVSVHLLLQGNIYLCAFIVNMFEYAYGVVLD